MGYTFLTGSQTARAQAFEYEGTLQPSQGKKSVPLVVSFGPLKVINILGHLVPNSLLWTMSKRQHVAQISTRWKGQCSRHSSLRKQKERGHVILHFIGQRIDSYCRVWLHDKENSLQSSHQKHPSEFQTLHVYHKITKFLWQHPTFTLMRNWPNYM